MAAGFSLDSRIKLKNLPKICLKYPKKNTANFTDIRIRPSV